MERRGGHAGERARGKLGEGGGGTITVERACTEKTGHEGKTPPGGERKCGDEGKTRRARARITIHAWGPHRRRGRVRRGLSHVLFDGVSLGSTVKVARCFVAVRGLVE